MKKSLKILTIVFAVIGFLAVAVVTIIILTLNHNKNTVTVTGPSMEPTLKSGQKVSLVNYSTSTQPSRGDIIEFTETSYRANANKEIILRVIGIPGDHLVIANGQVTISNSEHPTGFNPDVTYLPGNATTSGSRDVTLQAGQYYVLGDNRSNSLDSRIFGPITASQIIGKAQL